jgi:hypothetical protein
MENCQSSEQAPKNAPSPSRPVHALLGAFWLRKTRELKKNTATSLLFSKPISVQL